MITSQTDGGPGARSGVSVKAKDTSDSPFAIKALVHQADEEILRRRTLERSHHAQTSEAAAAAGVAAKDAYRDCECLPPRAAWSPPVRRLAALECCCASPARDHGALLFSPSLLTTLLTVLSTTAHFLSIGDFDSLRPVCLRLPSPRTLLSRAQT